MEILQIIQVTLYENNEEYKDIKKAIEYYLKGIELGNGYSANNLGDLYENNEEYKDIKKAIEYYLKGIELGNGNSANNLGYLYENNEEYKDIKKAIEYYLKGIELGNESSAYNLYHIYKIYMNDIMICKYEIVINALEQIFKTNEDNKYAEMLLDILENMYNKKILI